MSVLVLSSHILESGPLLNALSDVTVTAKGPSRFVKGYMFGKAITLGVLGCSGQRVEASIFDAVQTYAPKAIVVLGFCKSLHSCGATISDIVVPVLSTADGYSSCHTNTALSQYLCGRLREHIEQISWSSAFKPGVRRGQMFSTQQEPKEAPQGHALMSRGVDYVDTNLRVVLEAAEFHSIPAAAMKVVSGTLGGKSWSARARIGKALSVAALLGLHEEGIA